MTPSIILSSSYYITGTVFIYFILSYILRLYDISSYVYLYIVYILYVYSFMYYYFFTSIIFII